jgi:hypothetical protein
MEARQLIASFRLRGPSRHNRLLQLVMVRVGMLARLLLLRLLLVEVVMVPVGHGLLSVGDLTVAIAANAHWFVQLFGRQWCRIPRAVIAEDLTAVSVDILTTLILFDVCKSSNRIPKRSEMTFSF